MIGGGLAGASFAAHIAAAGRDVLLIEREPGPHDKVCGEFLSREALIYLRALGLDPAKLGAVGIETVGLAAGPKTATSGLPFPAMSLTRRVLDEAVLARAAASGARIRRGQRVVEATRQGGGFLLRLADGETVTAANALLATGKHDLRGHVRPSGLQNDLIGFKMMFALSPKQGAALAGRVELTLFDGGYAGLQPVERNQANLCLLVRRDRFSALGQRWPALLDDIGLQTPLLAARLEGAAPLWPKPLSVAGLPYGLVIRKPVEDGFWRLGDQAAVIPSFSGDGMSIALHSARLAATTYLAGDDAAVFQARLAADVGAQVGRATWLSRIFVRPRPQRGLLTAAQLVPAALQLGAALTRIPERNLSIG